MMNSAIKIVLLIFAMILCHQIAWGQGSDTQNNDEYLRKDRLTTVLLTKSSIYASGLFYMNNVWYKNHDPVPFHFYNDLPGWLQIDKTGHMYASYYQSYFGIKSLQWAGVSRKKAIWLGGSLSFLMQTPIEIFDGFYEGYGFSASDMVANTLGGALVISQELLWDEQRITMKFSYSPTKYPDYRPSTFGKTSLAHFFTDYNGHTYWLSANLSSFFSESKIPGWLNIAAGYGGDGMLAEFENPQYYKGDLLPEFERARQWYLSLDVNLEKIPVESNFLKKLLKALDMIKFPAPTVEINSTGQIVLHPIFF